MKKEGCSKTLVKEINNHSQNPKISQRKGHNVDPKLFRVCLVSIFFYIHFLILNSITKNATLFFHYFMILKIYTEIDKNNKKLFSLFHL